MLIRHFDPFGRRVPDPMRPGRTAVVTELRPSSSTSLTYTDESGTEFTIPPRSDGWFDVPEEVGRRLCRHRTAGSRGIGGGGFYTDAEVDDKYRLGIIAEQVSPDRTVASPPPSVASPSPAPPAPVVAPSNDEDDEEPEDESLDTDEDDEE